MAAADTFVKRVLAGIREHKLLDPSEKTLVAVSGGADSVCLLDVLHRAGFRLEVAHFDHQTRDGESGADAAFVRELAGGLGLPFHLESRPVAAEARQATLSFEEYARNARYDFLIRTATDRGCAAIATGHHADDQAETILMRIIRGTTPRGLAGIPPVRTITDRMNRTIGDRTIRDGTKGNVRIVRPLLDFTRAGILAYLEERGKGEEKKGGKGEKGKRGKGEDNQKLSYRIDRSNEDRRYLRNRVRHDLLPYLAREYNANVREALLRLGETQRAENEYLNALAESSLGQCLVQERSIDRRAFASLHLAIQRRVVVLWGWRWGVDLPFERVESAARFIMDGGTGRRFDLGEGISLCNGRATTEVVAESGGSDDAEIPLNVPGTTRAFGRVFESGYREGIPRGDLSRYCSPRRQVFDADALGAEVIVRHWRFGDRFSPLGMKGSKKVSDYFADIGLPTPERKAAILIVAQDRIAWIVGHAVSARVAVTARTRRFLEIEVKDEA